MFCSFICPLMPPTYLHLSIMDFGQAAALVSELQAQLTNPASRNAAATSQPHGPTQVPCVLIPQSRVVFRLSKYMHLDTTFACPPSPVRSFPIENPPRTILPTGAFTLRPLHFRRRVRQELGPEQMEDITRTVLSRLRRVRFAFPSSSLFRFMFLSISKRKYECHNHKTRKNKTRQGTTTTRQNKTGQGKTRQNKTGADKPATEAATFKGCSGCTPPHFLTPPHHTVVVGRIGRSL
jgi:hypothetical protein